VIYQAARVGVLLAVLALYLVGIYLLWGSAPGRVCTYPCGVPYYPWAPVIASPILVALLAVVLGWRRRRVNNVLVALTSCLAVCVWLIGLFHRGIFVPSN